LRAQGRKQRKERCKQQYRNFSSKRQDLQSSLERCAIFADNVHEIPGTGSASGGSGVTAANNRKNELEVLDRR